MHNAQENHQQTLRYRQHFPSTHTSALENEQCPWKPPFACSLNLPGALYNFWNDWNHLYLDKEDRHKWHPLHPSRNEKKRKVKSTLNIKRQVKCKNLMNKHKQHTGRGKIPILCPFLTKSLILSWQFLVKTTRLRLVGTSYKYTNGASSLQIYQHSESDVKTHPSPVIGSHVSSLSSYPFQRT